MVTWFLRTFDDPFQVLSHPYDRTDLLTLKDLSTGHVLPHPINIEKCVVVLDQDTFGIQPPNEAVIEPGIEDLPPVIHVPHVNPELSQVACEFEYLSLLPNKTATASPACNMFTYITHPLGKS